MTTPLLVAQLFNNLSPPIADLPLQNLRALGFGSLDIFGAATVGGGTGSAQAYFDGVSGAWRASIHRGFFVGDGPLTWDATAGQFTAILVITGFAGTHADFYISWRPEAFASVAVNRGVVDEAVDAGTACLRWDQPLVLPPLAQSVETVRTTAIWSTPPPAGPFSKVGTSGLPRAGGQGMRFLF